MKTWDLVIGLEIHAQLKTQAKLFSGASTTFGQTANTQTSYIDAGLPGTLPVLNKKAVEMAIQFGLAIHANINNNAFFERKNYVYADLPKGYQITQLQRPIVSDGYIDIPLDNHTKRVAILRAQLEEDAGKSLHDIHPSKTAIDLNRAGTPLLEIVTTPCLSSANEVTIFLKTLHQLLLFLDICDGNMQEGSFRCDVNLSLRPSGHQILGTRTELKNLNSFRFIEKAIYHEMERQQYLLESEQVVIQETRLYDPESNTTRTLRRKENANDYRYFPDPDLLPLHISTTWIEQLKLALPPLPSELEYQLKQDGQLNEQDIAFLLSSPVIYHYFSTVRERSKASAKLIVNWLRGPFTTTIEKIPPVELAALLSQIELKVITLHQAKTIFPRLLAGEALLTLLSTQRDMPANMKLEQIVRDFLAQHPNQVDEYRQGKGKLWAYFVGQIMRLTKGQADPEVVNQVLRQQLDQD